MKRIVWFIIVMLLSMGFFSSMGESFEDSSVENVVITRSSRGGSTNVSGIISTNTTWTLTNSPYIVTANVLVYQYVNLIPNMDLTYTIPIKLLSIENTFEPEFDEEASSIEVYETRLTFEVQSYLFPPIEEVNLVKRLIKYGTGFKQTIYDQYSPDNIISNGLSDLVSYSEQNVYNFQFIATKDEKEYIHIEDISSTISTYGEKLRLYDNEKNEIEFVYEYDNGELYASDFLVPSTLSLNKTGNILFKLDEIKINEQYDFFITTSDQENYTFAKDWFSIYDDFNSSINNLNA